MTYLRLVQVQYTHYTRKTHCVVEIQKNAIRPLFQVFYSESHRFKALKFNTSTL